MSKTPAANIPFLMKLFRIFILLYPIQYFCGYISNAPATITPLLMRLFHIYIYFLITPHPMLLLLYIYVCVQGTCNNYMYAMINESF